MDITLKTDVQTDGNNSAATLIFVKPDGSEHKKVYVCRKEPADSTTRAELKAIITGLKEIRCPCTVHLKLMIMNTVGAINQEWPTMWEGRRWCNRNGKLVKDWELWREILELKRTKKLNLTAEKRENERKENDA